MKIPSSIHRWDVTPKEAIQIQHRLAERLSCAPDPLGAVNVIAGIDVSFRNNQSCAAICVFSYPDLNLIEQHTVIEPITFPYVPTLLTFREAPAVLHCWQKVAIRPDVVLFDGQGIAHPRKMGLAAHMGIWLDIPTVGCAKTPLFGEFELPGESKGSYSYISGREGEIIGAVVRTRTAVKPVYVSSGYTISLENAIGVTMSVCTRYKIPEPLRAAHMLCKQTLIADQS